MLNLRYYTIRKKFSIIIFSFLILFPLNTKWAGPTQWKLNKKQSALTFKINSFLTNVHGTFRKFDLLDFSIKREKISGLLRIYVSSLDTKNNKRDGHLRNSDFFDVSKFPHGTVRVLNYDVSKQAGKARIILTIKGISRKLSIPVQVMKKKKTLIFSGVFYINRKDFKVDYDSRLNPIKDRVKLGFKLALSR